MSKIENAQITRTKLGEEHGCLTAEIYLRGEGWACGFGGYCLDHWFSNPGEYQSSDGYGAIIELMKTLNADSWEELKGKYVRVESNGWGGKISKIGNLMEDKWFSFDEYFLNVKKVNNHED